jgi:hypothetical protein
MLISKATGWAYATLLSYENKPSFLTTILGANKIWIFKLRTLNIKLPFETGRWRTIPKENRICIFFYKLQDAQLIIWLAYGV